jgi:hypothetical protein
VTATTDEPDELEAFFAKDHWLSHVSPEAVESALNGFSLPLVGGRDFKWLAKALRKGFAMSIPIADNDPARTSNSDIKAELVRLSDSVAAVRSACLGSSGPADEQLWTAAFHRWKGKADLPANNDPDFEYNRYQAALQELDWLASFLRTAADALTSQGPNWRLNAARRLRVLRAYFIAPIFEAAFGQPLSVNNWPNPQHKAPTPFMDFYQRTVALAFNERVTPDLSGVLKDAREHHAHRPATAYFEPDALVPAGGARLSNG